MTTAVYAGSFDPITYGHLDILNDGIKIFEKIIVVVAYNPDKKSFLPVSDRVDLIKKCTQEIPNIEVASYDGLTVDYAKQNNAGVLVRGIRNSADFEYENQLAQINSTLAKDIKTVFLSSKPEHSFISSSSVRELVAHKCSLKEYVPEIVADFLYKKFNY